MYSSWYHHHQIGSIHFSLSIFPIVVIFSMVLCLRCLLHHILQLIAYYCIYIPGNPGNCFHYLCAVHYESETYWLADRIPLFVHYTISFSSLCKFIWRYWTHKMPVRYILSSVWVRFSSCSVIQYTICWAVFSLPISFVMIERIYILCLIIILKSEIWTITHLLALDHEAMVCHVCLSIFYGIALWRHGRTWHNALVLTTTRIIKSWNDIANHLAQLWQAGDAENSYHGPELPNLVPSFTTRVNT